MTGTLRIMIAIAALIVAGYGIYFLWAGTLPEHTLKVIASYGVITLLVFVIQAVTKPAGEKH